MERPSKRRRPDKPDSSGLSWAISRNLPPPEDGLRIQGLACTIFGEGPDQEKLVMPWIADPEATVDRFDGRLLLESPSSAEGLPKGKDGTLPIEDTSQEELEAEAERYADLDPSREAELAHIAGWFIPPPAQEDDEGSPRRRIQDSNPEQGGLSAVGFSYDPTLEEPSEQIGTGQHEDQPAVPFRPVFDIPDDIKPPPTVQKHKVIRQTAKFVRGAGKQSIFVLRVKQGSNPNFDFLMPDNELHPYFQWLVETDPSEDPNGAGVSDNVSSNEGDVGIPGSALGLLSSYSSDTPHSEDPLDPSTETGRGAKSQTMADPEGPIEGPTSSGRPPKPEDTALPTAASSQAHKSGLSPEVEAIMDKLVAFVKRNGSRFEASVRKRERENPLFSFLHAENQHHAAYREKLAAALGPDEANALLPRLEEGKPVVSFSIASQPPAPITAATEDSAIEPLIGRAGEKLQQQAVIAPNKASSIRSNPALVNSMQPLTEARAMKLRKAAEGQAIGQGNGKDQQDGLSPSQHTEASRRGPTIANSGSSQLRDVPRAQGGGQDSSTAMDLLELEPSQEQTVVKASDEAKKAQRREMARRLLKTKLQSELTAAKQPAKTINHRAAFLIEDDDDSLPGALPEAGEIQPEAAPEKSAEAARPMPGLEELLRAKQQQTQPLFSELEVLSPSKPTRHSKSSKEHKKSSKHRSKDNGRKRHRGQKKSRHSPDSDGSSDDSYIKGKKKGRRK